MVIEELRNTRSTFLVGEIGQAHDGSLGIAHSLIDLAKHTGMDAIKIQVHIPERESSEKEPWRVKFSYEEESRYNYWRRVSFNKKQIESLYKHCKDIGIKFIASPFSIEAVNWLEDIGLDAYKIASGELTNIVLLDKIMGTGRDVIFSSGMSTLEELDEIFMRYNQYEDRLALLQCVSKYPCQPKDWALNGLKILKERYPRLLIGYSDHSGSIYSGLAAAALGAQIIEVHMTFDKGMFGPDATSSLDRNQLSSLVEGVRSIKCGLDSIDKNHMAHTLKDMRNLFNKSIVLNKDKLKGEDIQLCDMEFLKPLIGIPASQAYTIVGKVLKDNRSRGTYLSEADLRDEDNEYHK